MRLNNIKNLSVICLKHKATNTEVMNISYREKNETSFWSLDRAHTKRKEEGGVIIVEMFFDRSLY